MDPNIESHAKKIKLSVLQNALKLQQEDQQEESASSADLCAATAKAVAKNQARKFWLFWLW